MKEENKIFTEDDFVNQAELARHLKFSKPYISKLVKSGVLVFKDRKIQIKEAIKKINENTNSSVKKEVKELKEPNIDNSKKKKLQEVIVEITMTIRMKI